MPNKIGGLGRGLGSLIPNKKIADEVITQDNKEILLPSDKSKVAEVSVDLIEVNPHQPRQVFYHEGMEELIESIKVFGIIQPLILTKTQSGYQLIAGERRLRAAKIIGLNTVPALIRQAGEQEKLELALIENIQRRNLNPLEKAVSYERLMNEFNLTQDAVAQKLGLSRSVVANTIRFLSLPEKAQKALAAGQITEGHAKIIAGLESEEKQLEFLDKILKFDYSVAEAQANRSVFTRKTRRSNAPRIYKNPEIEEKEDMLRAKLNTKVSIVKSAYKGQIIIDFYAPEELNYIIDQIINK